LIISADFDCSDFCCYSGCSGSGFDYSDSDSDFDFDSDCSGSDSVCFDFGCSAYLHTFLSDLQNKYPQSSSAIYKSIIKNQESIYL